MNYIHNNINGRLKIKKLGEIISVCYLIDEPKIFNIKGELIFKTVIVKNENLIYINEKTNRP